MIENNPFGSGSYEAPNTGAEKPDKDTKKEKKAKANAVEALPEDKKQKAQRDLARSFDKLPLFERPEKSEKLEKPEKPEASAEKLTDELTNEEVKHVQQETARDHLEAIEQADAETAEELQPAAEFLQRVADGQDVEEAFTQTAAEAGLNEEEIAALNAEEGSETDAEANEADEVDDEQGEAEAEPESDDPEHGVIDTSSDSEGVVGWRTPVARNGKSGAGAPPSGGGSGGSGGGTPPVPPTPPSGSQPPQGGGPSVPQRGGPNQSSVAPNVMPNRANVYYAERNKAGELLLIGLVGYLIGRRRGRIRTEKKLLPVQRKLEKQVKHLEQDITYKEQQLVAVKAQKRQVEAGQARERLAQNRPLAEDRPVVTPIERTQPGRTETRLGMEKPARAERLGQMVIAAEAPRKTAEKPVHPSQSVRPEAVADLSRSDLLEVSEKITVQGASLRRIYESNLIGERQLRYLVSEHLKGHDIRRELRHEMIEHEIDFERDPILRDRVRSRLTGSDSAALSEMLAKAGIFTKEEIDPELKRRMQHDQERQAAAERKNQRQRLMVDSALITAIVVLAVAVVILALR